MQSIVIQIIFLVWTTGTAAFQALWFNRHMEKPSKFLHWTWALAYIIVVFLSTILACGVPDSIGRYLKVNFLALIQAALIRQFFFNPVLNRLRKPPKPLLYINLTDKSGSIERFYGKQYWRVWILSGILLLVSEFFL